MNRLILYLKTLNLPWKREKYIGSDLNGNLYFQAPPIGLSYKQKRFVVWQDKRHEYTPNSIDVLWSAWLRHTRSFPPTLQELRAEEVRLAELKIKVEVLNERDHLVRLNEPTGTNDTYQPGEWTGMKKDLR